MKQVLIAVVLLVTGFSVGSCKKENEECKALAQDVNFAASVYANNPNAANCGAYKTAINNYLNSSACASSLSATDRQSFQTQLNNLNC
jgi:hypothetical protein